MTTTPKETQILFKGSMVRRVSCGEKKQTRRVVKGMALEWLDQVDFDPEFVAARENGLCPYGFAGDHLWVRETYFAWGRWETRFSTKKGRDEWHFVDMTLDGGKAYRFEAHDTIPEPFGGRRKSTTTPAWWRRPAIHMPRLASRFTLKVTNVRIERLHSISEEDARAEGITQFNDGHGWHTEEGRHYAGNAVESYLALWADINGVESARSNPWVWAVSFERV